MLIYRDLPLKHEPQGVEIVKGGGMIAPVPGQHLAIGNRKLMTDQGWSSTSKLKSTQPLARKLATSLSKRLASADDA